MSPLTITIKENLQLKDVPPQLMESLVGKLEFVNPKWLENDRMGRWNRGIHSPFRPTLSQNLSI